jgi:hypothetical protein
MFAWFPLVSFSFVVLVDMVKKQLQNALIIALCVFAVISLVFNYRTHIEISFTPPTDDKSRIAAWMEEHNYTVLYAPWVTGSEIAARSDGAVALGAWHFVLFRVLPYINTLDIYTREDNASALYLISDSALDEALYIAESRGATLTEVVTFGPHTLYSSDLQLMTRAR